MASEAPVRTNPGKVRLVDTSTRGLVAGTNGFAVGALPEMLTFTPATNGPVVYDSGEILDREAIAAGIDDDGRNRDKGVEPEGVELMDINGRRFAFVGLERTLKSAVAAFDITDPYNTTFVSLLVSEGGRSSEGLKGYFLDGNSWLAFSNEVSCTTTVFQLARQMPEPGSLALVGLALAGLAMTSKRN